MIAIHRFGARRLCSALFIVLCGASQANAQGIFELFDGGGFRRAAPAARRRPATPKPKRTDAAKRGGQAAPAAAGQPAPQAVGEAPPPPYEPQMTRLAEILGGLSYLRDICGDRDGDEWRNKMSALLNADAPTGARRQRLTASFNRGFRSYELTYRGCTPNARLVISRYLDEAAQLSHEISYRYGNP